MKSVTSFHRIAASLLAAATVAGSFNTSAESSSAATGYVPFLPPILIPFPLLERPIVEQCAINESNFIDWFATRDVHVSSYNAWSIESVKFRYRAAATGTYSFKVTVRDTSRGGDVIVKSETKTINLTAGTPVSAKTFFGHAYVGGASTLSISHEDIAGPGTLFLGQSSAPCSDTLTTGTDGSVAASPVPDIGFEIRGDLTHHLNNVVEYYVPSLNKYFITAHANDQAALDALPDFQRTGRTFKVPKKSVYTNVINVYRFFSPEAVSHFYVDKTGHDTIVANPAFGLNDEGIDFGSVKPDYSSGAGQCPSWASVKILRSYHGASVVNQRNHRYTNNNFDYNAMSAIGWAPEGVAFCAYSATNPL
jgi:hypothetical protein